MLATILLAGVCAWQPSFSGLGLPCSPANQEVECRCGECLQWDAALDSQSAALVRWYNVERTDPDGSVRLVGRIDRLEWLDEESVWRTEPPSAFWCAARDVPMVREGAPYGYRVQSCNFAGCSAWSEPVEYVGAPYAIDHFRPPVQGN